MGFAEAAMQKLHGLAGSGRTATQILTAAALLCQVHFESPRLKRCPNALSRPNRQNFRQVCVGHEVLFRCL